MNLRNCVIRSCTWIACLLPLLLQEVDAFSTNHKVFKSQIPTHSLPTSHLSTQLNAQQKSRRSFFQVTSAIAFGTLTLQPNESAWAAEKEPTIWKSGKTPIVPGQKPKDKNDTSGTRKDSSFLRSISACKSQCETTNGSDGYARAKEECLSDCQDICCTTYEQCTFGIVPRI